LHTFEFWDWPVMEYVLFEDSDLSSKRKVPADCESRYYSNFIGSIGLAGLTAYLGLFDIGEPTEGETLVVSGASGAVGTIAGQLGKLFGLHVVGITSTQTKADIVLNELNFDSVILYKNKTREDLIEEIKQKCPNGVDIYFDNVGGEISYAVYNCLNHKARIPICGQIARYHDIDFGSFDEVPEDIENIVIEKSVHRQFFMGSLGNFGNLYVDAYENLYDKVKKGKLISKETLYHGIESWPKAFIGLFEGGNIGKSVVKLKMN